MNKTKMLLQKLTESLPPNGKMRHNITLSGESLELTLMLGERWISFLLDDSDMEGDITTLAQDIYVETKKQIATKRKLFINAG